MVKISPFYVALVVVALCVANSKADDLQIGNPNGGILAYLENVKLAAIPFKTRTKNVFYSSERNQIIKAISARDLNQSKGKATVTSGGVGSTFANVRIKSEKGSSLNYQVQIFV